MRVPGRFLENMGTHIFFKKAPSVDFFMAITLNSTCSKIKIITINILFLWR